MSFWAKIWKKIDIYHFFKGKKSTKHAILSYFSATFQLFFPHSSRVFLKNVKCCFGFVFEKMSKLRGVENAHRWRHMVRLTQRSTTTECYKWRWIPSIVWRSTHRQFFYSPSGAPRTKIVKIMHRRAFLEGKLIAAIPPDPVQCCVSESFAKWW